MGNILFIKGYDTTSARLSHVLTHDDFWTNFDRRFRPFSSFQVCIRLCRASIRFALRGEVDDDRAGPGAKRSGELDSNRRSSADTVPAD